MLVAVGHHGAATVPPPLADDVEGPRAHRVGRADDRADVEVVTPVLDRDVEVVPPGVEVGDDRLVPPVAVGVDDVAPVALAQQVRVPVLTRRPVPHPRPDAHLQPRSQRPSHPVRAMPPRLLPVHAGPNVGLPGRLATGSRDRATARATPTAWATGDQPCEPRRAGPSAIRPTGADSGRQAVMSTAGDHHPAGAPGADPRHPRVDGGRGLRHQGARRRARTRAQERQGDRPRPGPRAALGAAAAQDDGRRVSLRRAGLPSRRGRLVGGVGARPHRSQPQLRPR